VIVNVFNKTHYVIKIGKFKFEPFEEVNINVYDTDKVFTEIRSNKGLRVGKHNNEAYKKKHGLIGGHKINFCYDAMNQHAGNAYKYAIEALANPIIKHLGKIDTGYVDRPLVNLNCRFFNSKRIAEHGKAPVGSNDIFFSHGIGDKNYWIGPNVKDYKYTFVWGPAWEKRMRKTGYKGEIFVCGYTKLDPLLNGELEAKKHDKPYVVWAPTHGYASKHKGRSSFPECLSLIKEIPEEYETKMSMHPTSKLHAREKHTPTLIELLEADVVIADAGSTLYEAWILGKPVIFPDWLCSADTMKHFEKDKDNFEYQIYSKKIGYHAKDMQHMNKLIEIAIRDGMKDEEKEFIESIYPTELRGKAGKTAAKYLKQLLKRLG
jgi:hypothetical protein